MLLRRVAGHVRGQNWTAVGIDFMIVVVGVFIGIQVSNWNEERQENAGRQLYRAQLIGDLEQIEKRANRDVELYAGRVLATSRVLGVLRSSRGAPDDPEQFERDLLTVGRASAPIPRSPTVVELISSGRMGAMAAHELRVQIVRFDQFIQAAERAAEVITDVWMQNTRPLNSRLTLVDRISDDGRELLSSRLEYDLEAMRGDPVLVPSLSAVLRVHLMEVDWRAGIAQQAAELRHRMETP